MRTFTERNLTPGEGFVGLGRIALADVMARSGKPTPSAITNHIIREVRLGPAEQANNEAPDTGPATPQK